MLTWAQLQVVPDDVTQAIFGGDGRRITVVFRNPTDKPLEVGLRTRLTQVSSATAIPLGEKPWKKLLVPSGLTVMESANVNFPVVTARTRFLVQWVEAGQRVIGTTHVNVYPTNLLKELRVLAGEQPLGVLDPANQLKPLLTAVKVEFADFERSELEHFTGRLAVFGPFASRDQMPPRLRERIAARCKTGVAAVWFQPAVDSHSRFAPSFYPVPVGTGVVMVAEAKLVASLPENPVAQLNLIRLARLAVRPEPFRLPELNPQLQNEL
jgi:hypothetical protein